MPERAYLNLWTTPQETRDKGGPLAKAVVKGEWLDKLAGNLDAALAIVNYAREGATDGVELLIWKNRKGDNPKSADLSVSIQTFEDYNSDKRDESVLGSDDGIPW